METSSRHRAERRLAAILAADIAGYSRLIGADEEGTLGRMRSLRAEVIDPAIAEHRGRLVKTTGDGLLVEFASVVDALRCAVQVQQAIADRTASLAEAERLEYRIGIHQGDVVVEDGDLFGDGVNVAARLEALAEPGGICVSARVQEDAVGRLDLTFEDIGEQQLKNIVRAVRVYRIRPVGPLSNAFSRARTGSGRNLAMPDKPSIAVLPFKNFNDDSAKDYFADVMVEEIITALSRIRWLFVIACNSTFTYKGQPINVKQAGRELGVQYLLQGSVRYSEGQVRIAAQLVDTNSGENLWADHFDGALDQVFELQDKVAADVAGIIEPTLQSAEIRRIHEWPTRDLKAYDLYLRALAPFSELSRSGNTEALSLLNEAIARDGRYGPALALAACCHLRAYLDGWTADPESDARKGINFARMALQSSKHDPVTLASAAYALAEFGEDINTMLALIDRCLTLNPSYARAWYFSGALRVDAGYHDVAIAHVERSLRLSPRERMGAHFSVLGSAHFFSGQFDKALEHLLIAVHEHPDHVWPFRFLAACYVQMGRYLDARSVAGRLREITSVVIPTHMPFRKAEDRELLLAGLRNASEEDV